MQRAVALAAVSGVRGQAHVRLRRRLRLPNRRVACRTYLLEVTLIGITSAWAFDARILTSDAEIGIVGLVGVKTQVHRGYLLCSIGGYRF